jgi:transcription initiation factor IIF auxiliary subunit
MASKSIFKIQQDQRYEGDDWWAWSVWLDGPAEDLDRVASVEYTLHHTFRDPVRVVKTRRNQFKLATEGWGVFPIYAQVSLKDGKVVRLKHQLKLTYPTGKPNKS